MVQIKLKDNAVPHAMHTACRKNIAKAKICVDQTKLKKPVIREQYEPVPDEITAKTGDPTVVSSLDVAGGFRQIPPHLDS